MEIKAYGKINLALDVVDKRDDGYHNIDTVMQEINLHDNLIIDYGRSGFALTCDDESLELNENNLVYKAWNLMREKYDGNPAVIIHIEKNIPIAAGLAGGSTDCAATIKGLNELWNLDLTNEEMADLGVKLGADVPFFFYGGTQRARGIGEKLSEVKNIKVNEILLISNKANISSKYVYENLESIDNNIDISKLVEKIESDDDSMYLYMKNKLEEVSFKIYPELEEIKKDLKNTGAKVSLMSGSGPTVFGLFNTKDEADKAENILKEKYSNIIRTSTKSYGQ